MNDVYSEQNPDNTSPNLTFSPLLYGFHIPTREYIPTIHSVHVTTQMLLASQ